MPEAPLADPGALPALDATPGRPDSPTFCSLNEARRCLKLILRYMGGSLLLTCLVEEREELGASPLALLLPESPVLMRLLTAPTDLEEPADWFVEALRLRSRPIEAPPYPLDLTSFCSY